MYDMYYCSNMYNGGLVVCVSHNIEVSCIFLATSCGNLLLIGYCPEMYYYGSYVAYHLSSRLHGALAHSITISNLSNISNVILDEELHLTKKAVHHGTKT